MEATQQAIEVRDGKDRSSTVKLSAEAKQNFYEDEAADMIGRSPYVRTFMSFVWLGASCVFCLYLYEIASQYIQGQSTPSSSITVFQEEYLLTPKVVVCNWNQDGSFANNTPTHNCDECLLSLVSCTNLNTSEDCRHLWQHTPIETAAGLFDCFTYNGDFDHPIHSITTGYSGSIATVWGVYLPPTGDPPANRAGAQVSFINLDGAPTSPAYIYNEYRFCPVGYDTFYAMQYINTLHTEDNLAANLLRNSSAYATVNANVNLLSPGNATFGYIGVSFAFQTLSKQINLFFTGYTLQNFWGDFAGMVGTLMGLDLMKVCSSLPVAWVAFKLRSLGPLEEHYNG